MKEKNGSFSATNKEYFCGRLWGGKGLIKFAFYILNVIPARYEVAASWVISSVCLNPLFLCLSCWEEGRRGSNSVGRRKFKKGKEKSCWDELAQQGAADEAKLKPWGKFIFFILWWGKIWHRIKTRSTPKRRNFHARRNTGLYKDFMCLPFNLHLFCLLEYERQGDDFQKWHI